MSWQHHGNKKSDSLYYHITDRITHEVEGINRVVMDLTPKPIGTIEWE